MQYTPLRQDEDTPIDDTLCIRDFVDNELDNTDNNTKYVTILQSNCQPPTVKRTNQQRNEISLATMNILYLINTRYKKKNE